MPCETGLLAAHAERELIIGDRDRRAPFPYSLMLVFFPPLSVVIYSPHGRPPPPPAFATAADLYCAAWAAYDALDYRRAANGSQRGAALVLNEPKGFFAESAAERRSALYLNAAYAWLMARDPETARATFVRLCRQKRASPEDLKKAYHALANP